ncbi:hypothetical protein X975_15891, partial [Stegodyphus mimosarum]
MFSRLVTASKPRASTKVRSVPSVSARLVTWEITVNPFITKVITENTDLVSIPVLLTPATPLCL